ncbi:hypothetical protein SAMN02927924_02829 [Sphingobium faniae]|nr:hypothetical protein SAMN02927924_02829 [Sphingobium faniae]
MTGRIYYALCDASGVVSRVGMGDADTLPTAPDGMTRHEVSRADHALIQNCLDDSLGGRAATIDPSTQQLSIL